MERDITIDIQCDNAAFEDSPEQEVARILKELSEKIAYGLSDTNLRDINGNIVGNMYVNEYV